MTCDIYMVILGKGERIPFVQTIRSDVQISWWEPVNAGPIDYVTLGRGHVASYDQRYGIHFANVLFVVPLDSFLNVNLHLFRMDSKLYG